MLVSRVTPFRKKLNSTFQFVLVDKQSKPKMPPIKVPKRRDLYLVFDTETTGIIPYPPRNSTQPMDLSACPFILQISAVLYSMHQQKIVDSFDYYINIPDSVEIPEATIAIHGITRDICKSKGVRIIDAIRKFNEFYRRCDGYVGHNIGFDIDMIKIEVERNRAVVGESAPECLYLFNDMYERTHNIEKYCTMDKGRKMCNIEIVSEKTGKPYIKSPRLLELYRHLFPSEPEPEKLHNAMFDVYATLRCYLKMRHNLEYSVSM